MVRRYLVYVASLVRKLLKPRKLRVGVFYCKECSEDFKAAVSARASDPASDGLVIECPKCGKDVVLTYTVPKRQRRRLGRSTVSGDFVTGTVPQEGVLEDGVPFFVGSSPDNHMVVGLRQVAPRHVSLLKTARGVTLCDYEDFYPTYVNKKLVRETEHLHDGDVMSLSGLINYKLSDGVLTRLNSGVGLELELRDCEIKVAEKTFTVNICLPRGAFACLAGPSGCGKSVVLENIHHMLTSDGAPIPGVSWRLQADQNRRPHFCYAPQSADFPADLTVREILKLYGRIQKLDQLDMTVSRVIASLGLWDRRQVRFHKLSGGEQKRVCVAVSILTTPDLLILDEPTAGLNPELAIELLGYLKGLSSAGVTILLCKHDTFFASEFDVTLRFDGRHIQETDGADTTAF